MLRLFAFSAERRAIVLTHSGCPGSFPEDFIPFVERHPQATLILAHLGNSADGNLARHEFAEMAEADRRAILYDNAARLLGETSVATRAEAATPEVYRV